MKKLVYPMMALAVAVVALCGDSPVVTRVMAADTASSVQADMDLEYVGAVRGYVETCGCHSGNYGGIARRATYLHGLRKDLPTLAVFAGGMRIGSGALSDNAAQTLWDAFAKMGYDAATVSSEDLPDLAKMPAAARKLITVANVTMQDGSRIAPPVLYKDIKTKSGKTEHVAIIGLLGKSPYLTAPNPDSSPADMPWKVTDPEAALRMIMPEARKNADIVVVLFSGSRDPARQIVKDVPGADVMVVGMEGAVDSTVEKIGNTAIVQNGERGRFASTLGIAIGNDKKPADYTITQVPLSDSFTDDPVMAKMVDEFRARRTAATPVPVTVPNPNAPAAIGS
jgi:2',3'-cyclic-nucleotide 2'-phosphodiesterase (5'-nucleotidase family)